MSQKNSLGQRIRYEPLSSADLSMLPAALRFEVLYDLASKGPIQPGDVEAAIDAKFEAQRTAAPHAERDATLKPRP